MATITVLVQEARAYEVVLYETTFGAAIPFGPLESKQVFPALIF